MHLVCQPQNKRYSRLFFALAKKSGIHFAYCPKPRQWLEQ